MIFFFVHVCELTIAFLPKLCWYLSFQLKNSQLGNFIIYKWKKTICSSCIIFIPQFSNGTKLITLELHSICVDKVTLVTFMYSIEAVNLPCEVVGRGWGYCLREIVQAGNYLGGSCPQESFWMGIAWGGELLEEEGEVVSKLFSPFLQVATVFFCCMLYV